MGGGENYDEMQLMCFRTVFFVPVTRRIHRRKVMFQTLWTYAVDNQPKEVKDQIKRYHIDYRWKGNLMETLDL